MKLKYIMFSMLISLYGCMDFMEENMSDTEVTIIAPPHQATISSSTQTFWWEEVEGAIHYKIQMARPSFDDIQQLIIDSMSTDNKFDYPVSDLTPGNYEWRVRAQNESSQGSFVTKSFTVSSELDISDERVQLTDPEYGASFSSYEVDLSWESVMGAEWYIIQFDDDITDGFQSIEALEKITSQSNLGFTADDKYDQLYWRVRGENEISTSRYSEVRAFELDTETDEEEED